MSTFLSGLESRGLIHDVSHAEELGQLLQSKSITFYCGFDPTAESLHVGHMLPLLLMRRLQRAGHKPIVLLGSATGMIGDPSGKSEERNLLNVEQVVENAQGMAKQIERFLDATGPTAYTVVRNDSWLSPIGFIDFLRDVGKHFSVNAMITKDSVRSRIESREHGISFTEFSYMLLQAYDFYHLNMTQDCVLQVGGSDQWGNITAGLELIRRKGGNQAFGLTFPLLCSSSGAKFGKTERGAVWLSPERTTPYEFYQFWLNTPDADVASYLRLFTEQDEEKIQAAMAELTTHPEARAPQKLLAAELTALVHGQESVAAAEAASKVLFGGSLDGMSAQTLLGIFSDVPSTTLPAADLTSVPGLAVPDLLVKTGVADSKSAARRLVEGGGVYLNNQRVTSAQETVTLDRCIEARVLVIRSGKKHYHLVQVQS